jgi:predicted lipoprotein with Yx(FWY)xxD motif
MQVTSQWSHGAGSVVSKSLAYIGTPEPLRLGRSRLRASCEPPESSNDSAAWGSESWISTTGQPVKVTSNPRFGRILTNAKGITLYYLKSDGPNQSTCFGGCAQAWPPLLVTGHAGLGSLHLPGKLATIARSGTFQVTYNSWPLYTFIGDRKPGDTTGQGIAGVWFVATPGLRPHAAPRVVPPAPSCIPGMNGGDMDGDNNGEPSDGDGCR